MRQRQSSPKNEHYVFYSSSTCSKPVIFGQTIPLMSQLLLQDSNVIKWRANGGLHMKMNCIYCTFYSSGPIHSIQLIAINVIFLF